MWPDKGGFSVIGAVHKSGINPHHCPLPNCSTDVLYFTSHALWNSEAWEVVDRLTIFDLDTLIERSTLIYVIYK